MTFSMKNKPLINTETLQQVHKTTENSIFFLTVGDAKVWEFDTVEDRDDVHTQIVNMLKSREIIYTGVRNN